MGGEGAGSRSPEAGEKRDERAEGGHREAHFARAGCGEGRNDGRGRRRSASSGRSMAVRPAYADEMWRTNVRRLLGAREARRRTSQTLAKVTCSRDLESSKTAKYVSRSCF